MDIKEEDIVGIYKLKDGNKYIFLTDETVYREEADGKLNKIELTKNNVEKIKRDIGTGKTDVAR